MKRHVLAYALVGLVLGWGATFWFRHTARWALLVAFVSAFVIVGAAVASYRKTRRHERDEETRRLGEHTRRAYGIKEHDGELR